MFTDSEHKLHLPQTGVRDEGFLVVWANTEDILMGFSVLVAHQLVLNGVEDAKNCAEEAQKYTDPQNI